MTKDEIICMAREAGSGLSTSVITLERSWVFLPDDLERFAALIASRVAAAAKAEEREIRTEALALLQTIHMGNESKRSQDIIGAAMRVLQKHVPEELAAAIRERSANAGARGETSSRGQT